MAHIPSLQTVNLFGEGSDEKGEMARMSTFLGAIAVSDLVKSTLGPKGMDKILQNFGEGPRGGDVMVTNDGATILKSIHTENPAAKILVDISKTQDDEVGDGTTSVCVFAGELLREAEKLVEMKKIHPQTVALGFRDAQKAALAALSESALDNGKDTEKLKVDLFNIARTTLSSKLLNHEKDQFAHLAVDAILRLEDDPSLENIKIIKKLGGSLTDSFLEEGFILEKKMGVGQPKRLENAKILIANTAMDTDKIKIYAGSVRTESAKQVGAIEAAERARMIAKCQKIVDHGVNCFINRQLIYNLPEQFFTEHGVLSIEHADFDGIERLSKVTGGEIVSTFDHPELVTLGTAKVIEEIMLGEDKVIRFSGVGKGQACTVVLRGATHHMLDEAERSLHDALCVVQQAVKETRTVYGGGAAETLMAAAVDELATKTPGKRAHAIEAYAMALRRLPTIVADNGGYDSAELVSQLRAEHTNGNKTACLDMTNGTIGDAAELNIVEAFKVKESVVRTATEAAEMILRVDRIIRAAPRKREEDDMHH